MTARSEVVVRTTSRSSSHDQQNYMLRPRQAALRRKRSLSVADIPAPPRGFADVKNRNNHIKKVVKSEESGYDSDATRKSSPRGSLKVASLMEKADSGKGASEDSDDSGNVSGGVKKSPTTKQMNTIKKPPRKSKLPEATFKTNNKPSSHLFKKNGEDSNNNNLPLDFGDNLPSGLPSLSSKRFKMLRLRGRRSDEDDGSGTSELGIVISKKRHPQKGTTGYVIAHMDKDGLVER